MEIKVDLEKSGIDKKDIMKYKEQVENIHKDLHRRKDAQDDFVGWLDLPSSYDKKEFKRIETAAKRINKDSDILLVIGIGGSYLGARAVIEELIEVIGDKDFSINVISKSGTTTEPAIAFRIFREILENKYGIDEARSRIYVTTDKAKGALKTLSDEEGYETFIIPDNVGGRFSVLTPVGLLPIATAGIDIEKLMKGAKLAQDNYNDNKLKYNECYQYAVLRNILYEKGKTIEVFANYEPKMHYMTEWLKQLFGESEGKDSKGIFPAGIDLTTDLHSMGQYMQEGLRNLFETVIYIEKSKSNITINSDDDNLDGLNYLAGKDLDFVNKKAMEGTIEAHVSGGVPNIVIKMENLDEENLGGLIYFFELATAVSGNLLNVNPFNQPGVEEYKKNMFTLLEKPGYKTKKKR